MFLIFRHVKKNEDPGEIEISEKERQHLRAARVSKKEKIYLGDGRKRRWPMRLEEGSSRAKPCASSQSHFWSSSEALRIVCMALPERHRLEKDFLPAAVQLGMSHFQPLLCDYSVRSRFTSQRLRSILRESASQSLRFFLPRLLRLKDMGALRDFLRRLSFSPRHILALHPEAKLTFDSHCRKYPHLKKEGIALIVGPEGGFSSKELEHFQKMSYTLLRLGSGENILRVTTAALAALAKLMD